MELLERERDKHRQEIAALLTRIQHPEVIQATSSPVEDPDLKDPKEIAAYAHVGQLVPEFVDVGGENGATD